MDSLLTAPLVAKQSTEYTDSVCYTHLANSYVYLFDWLFMVITWVTNQTHFIVLSLLSAAVHVGCSDLPLCHAREAFPIEETREASRWEHASQSEEEAERGRDTSCTRRTRGCYASSGQSTLEKNNSKQMDSSAAIIWVLTLTLPLTGSKIQVV